LQTLHFHHVGIPVPEKMPGMTYNKALKLYSTGYFETPYAIEWMYFEENNTLPEIIKKIPHVAYRVDDLNAAIEGKEIILAPNIL